MADAAPRPQRSSVATGNESESLLAHADRLLAGVALGHVLVALVCIAALTQPAPPVLGVHPALKPLKFALSLALFLATFAILLPALSLGLSARRSLAIVLSCACASEMAAIAFQAARGRTSHFNRAAPSDAAIVTVMLVGVACIALVLVVSTVVAVACPLRLDSLGVVRASLLTLGLRSGLLLSLLALVSGTMMGGRRQHTVGGPDGGPGRTLLDWSREHGDLRVSHFFALHALQVLPLVALALSGLPVEGLARQALMTASIVGYAALVVGTLLQALAAYPFR